MREIKFRGRERESNKWVFGYARHWKCCCGDEWHIQGKNDNVHIVIPESIGQYTGLRDADGREIYEGDVLNNSYGRLGVSYKQEWAAFVARGIDATGYYHEYLLDEVVNTPVQGLEIKVIGNVYDNPELLEEMK